MVIIPCINLCIRGEIFLNYINEEYIEEYIRSILPERSDYLKSMEEYADRNHVPIVQPEVAQFLRVLLLIKKPGKILEVGTAIGYSSIVMGEFTGQNCNITTIEKREDMVSTAEKNIEKTNFKDRINIIKGEAMEILPFLKDKYDFIFLDAAKGHYLEFFNCCIELLNKDGIIVSDNVLYKGMVATDELVVRRKKTIVKRMRQYLKYISELEGFHSSIIPIGDGIAVTCRV